MAPLNERYLTTPKATASPVVLDKERGAKQKPPWLGGTAWLSQAPTSTGSIRLLFVCIVLESEADCRDFNTRTSL